MNGSTKWYTHTMEFNSVVRNEVLNILKHG